MTSSNWSVKGCWVAVHTLAVLCREVTFGTRVATKSFWHPYEEAANPGFCVGSIYQTDDAFLDVVA